MPHALNEQLYTPPAEAKRIIDIGFRGAASPLFIGDQERTDFIRYFKIHAGELDLRCDIDDTSSNLKRSDWATFLQSCRGIVGAESGSYYLDPQGEIIAEAKEWCRKNPQATFAEVFTRFFENPPPHFSGKAISSRHFEAIGTQTCQILLEGEYNGLLTAGEHYISVKKDLSNIQEAVETFKDPTVRRRITEQAYQHIMESHTYAQRARSLIEKVMPE
jgi:hypothetical protein